MCELAHTTTSGRLSCAEPHAEPPPRAPRGLDRGRGRDGFRIKPSGALRTLPAAAFFPATRFVPDVFAAFTTTRVELTANMCLGGGGARV